MDTELSPFGHHVETTEHHLGKTEKERLVLVNCKAAIYEEFIMGRASSISMVFTASGVNQITKVDRSKTTWNI